MNAPRKISAFKSGNSIALRVPKSSGIKAGDQFELVERGGKFELLPVIDFNHEKAELEALARELREIGQIGGDPNDGRIEFPDRPGLY